MSLLRLQGRPSAYSQSRRHGLDAAEIEAMRARQGGLCYLCGRDLGTDAVIDHDRELARLHPHPVDRGCRRCVRGLLHRQENAALGVFGDDPERLERAARYIRMARGQL